MEWLCSIGATLDFRSPLWDTLGKLAFFVSLFLIFLKILEFNTMREVRVAHRESSEVVLSAPSLPAHIRFLSDPSPLVRVLSNCQKASEQRGCPQIVSISIEIPAIDPLNFMRSVCPFDEEHFYIEKAGSGAIAAMGSVLLFSTSEVRRFQAAKSFVRAALSKTVAVGATHLPFSGPHFFCRFTFFDRDRPRSIFSPVSIFLPKWQVARHENTFVFVANSSIDPNTDIIKISQQIWHVAQQVVSIGKSCSQGNCNANSTNLSEIFSEQNTLSSTLSSSLDASLDLEGNLFRQSVRSILRSLRETPLRKAVLARAVDITSARPFQTFACLQKLRSHHPSCYIFSTGRSGKATFLGASPECLASLRDGCLNADALAGSAPRGKTFSEDMAIAQNFLNNEKERREHQLVVQFIKESLAALQVELEIEPISILRLSNIQHLRTQIRARVPDGIELFDLLEQLHPTPAMAGVPKKIALQEIERHETFDRELYAAPLGWIDSRGNGEFIVGIRSALIENNRARLYAGAGIVAGSDPTKELAETRLKLQAFCKAIEHF